MTFVLFITGASGSGKTTLYESLRQDARFHGIEFHDIDEHGVPSVGRGAWRSFRAEELLYEAGQALENGKSSVICGIIKPHEIVESRYFKPEMNVHFALLDANYETVEARLKERLASQPRLARLIRSLILMPS